MADNLSSYTNGDIAAVRSFRRALLALVCVVILGGLGYYVIETVFVDWGWVNRTQVHENPQSILESIYFAVVTISSTGYGELYPKTRLGQIYVTCFLILGLTTVTWAGANIVAFIVEGQLSQAVRERKMLKLIEQLEGHYVICGLGRVGMEIVRRFRTNGQAFVVIDSSEENLARNLEETDLKIVGDCTDEEILRIARIDTAKGMVTATPDDSSNVFTILTAKELNPHVFVIARGEQEETRSKMIRAGADRVVIPSHIGGQRMANMALHPAIVDFLDQTFLLSSEGDAMVIEEYAMEEGNPMIGKKLRDTHIKSETEVLIIGIKCKLEGIKLNPSSNYTIQAGDILIGLGLQTQLKRLKTLMQR